MKVSIRALHNDYVKALLWGSVWQVFFSILGSLLLDGGVTFFFFLAVSGGFWIGTALIILRRPLTPTSTDLIFVRSGLPILSLSCLVVLFLVAQ